jgi:hypothetical protein
MPNFESREMVENWAAGRGVENYIAPAMAERWQTLSQAADRADGRVYNVLFVCTGNLLARRILAAISSKKAMRE